MALRPILHGFRYKSLSTQHLCESFAPADKITFFKHKCVWREHSSLLLISGLASTSNLKFDDFFRDNKELNTPLLKKVIMSYAIAIYELETVPEKEVRILQFNKSKQEKREMIQKLLIEMDPKSYEYAEKAIVFLQDLCDKGDDSIFQLDDENCNIISDASR